MGDFLRVTLPKKIKIKTLGKIELEIDKIEIFQMLDSPVKKTVFAYCRTHPNKILLWEKDAYDAIGQWTDTDVINRVLELYSK